MSNINKAAVLNPFPDLTANILNYVPRATTSEFGIVAIGSGINVDALGRIYLDTQEYSDRLTAIEAQAASSLDTQQTEVAAAIAQVNLTQSQTITALTLEVSNLQTNLTNSIAATQTDLINRADQLAQDVTDITVQLTRDKATFTQEIQDAIDTLQDEASLASALRTPRKIQGVDFDGTQDISLPTFTTETDGLVPKRVGATTTKYLREDGTWVVPPDTTYALLTAANAEAGTATSANSISAKVLKDAIKFHAPPATDITGNAGTATKLQTPRTISLSGGVTGSVSFDGSANASIATTVTGLGAANGIATLDSNGQVPSIQLPSFVDDVLEYLNVAAFPTTGVAGKIYVETTGNTTYRWGGTGYVKITSGEVSSVAGKTGIVTLSKADVGLASVDNTPDTQKPISEVTQQALNDKVNKADVISVANGGTGATTVEGAKQSLGLQHFIQGEDVTSIYSPYTPGGDSRIVITKTGWGIWSSNPNFDTTLSMHHGGTGATTAAEARANLGLGTAATMNVGTQAGNVMEVGAFGLGENAVFVTNDTPLSVLRKGFITIGNQPAIVYGQHWGASYNGILRLPTAEQTEISVSRIAIADTTIGQNTDRIIVKTTANTQVDPNGFIKAASPVVNLFSDKIELNNEAKEQPITFEKLGVGDYLIKGSTGLALEGWYIEQPKDANGNVFHAVIYETLDNGDLSIKTYAKKLNEIGEVVADLSTPLDIKEGRFISIRLNELPKDVNAPPFSPEVDSEGSYQPTRYHTLEEGAWIISEEDSAKLEQERLAAMQPLKRRQFRLTLAMNGYDLAEIESLINQIEDPMQRTIAQIEWQDATDFERTNPTLLMMTELMHLTSEQVDQLWSHGLAL